MKKAKLITSSAVVMTMVMSSIVPAFAYSKEETVYSKLKTNGSEKTTVVSEHLINDQNETSLDDQSSLKNIKNVNGKETLKQETIKKVENRAIALVNNKIVYATGTQLKMMSLNGKDDQILFKNIVVSDLQVLGSDLFTKGYVQESGVKYIVFNIKGQYKALNENTAQEFENLQDA